MISIQTEGRRTYITGDTYPVRDRIRAIGAKWDATRKAWWTGKRAEAETLVAELNETAPAPAAEERSSDASNAPRDGLDSVVAGRAEYKGKTYYVAGRIDRGRTHWDDEVAPVTTRDGAKVLLYFRDGSRQFWAPLEAVRFLRGYSRPQTIRSLRDYAEQAKTHGTAECRCACHREPNAGAPGTTLYDGCDRCGCETC